MILANLIALAIGYFWLFWPVAGVLACVTWRAKGHTVRLKHCLLFGYLALVVSVVDPRA